jgi:RHS repeat-associated protein
MDNLQPCTSASWQLLVVWDGSETGERQLQWLVQDHLGSTRMMVDRSGSLGGVRRNDFLPFGELIGSGVGIRSASIGYGDDSVRQKFTGYERDDETGLDFAQARYYANGQGRFTSVDPYNIAQEVMATASVNAREAAGQLVAYLSIPQQWNRYAYAVNNPLRYVDPTGEGIELFGNEDQRKQALLALKAAVGTEAGKYLYENKVVEKDGTTRYFVGILGNGPDGKSLPFEQLNDVTKEFFDIHIDTKIVGVTSVDNGTVITADTPGLIGILLPSKAVVGPIDEGRSPGYTGMVNGRLMVHILNPWTHPKHGSLPGSIMSNGQPGPVSVAETAAHELGHARARMTGDPNSDGVALRLENKVRRLVDKAAPIRIKEKP